MIPDQEFRLGTQIFLSIFLDWLVKNQGLSIIMPSYTPKGNITELEKFLSVLGDVQYLWAVGESIYLWSD